MSGKRKVEYYRVIPIFPIEPGQIANAAVQTCLATGRVLSGMGGGGQALAPEIVHALDMQKQGGKSRMICDADEYENLLLHLKSMVSLLRETVSGVEHSEVIPSLEAAENFLREVEANNQIDIEAYFKEN